MNLLDLQTQFSANVAPVLLAYNTLMLRMFVDAEKKCFADLNAIFHTSSQQSIFPVRLRSKLMKSQSFHKIHKCVVGNSWYVHVHLKRGANT